MTRLSRGASATSRREFLERCAQLAGELSLAGLLAGTVACSTDERAPVERLRMALSRLPAPPEALPEAPLAGWSAARAEQTLLRDVSEARRREVLADGDALLRWLEERQRADFEQGRSVDVDGWILSETELAALVLLAMPR